MAKSHLCVTGGNDKMISARKTAFTAALAVLLFIFGNVHSLFINQPQTAILPVLGFLYYFRETFEAQSYKNYFVYGILLGLSFAMSHIYAPLVLIVPFAAFQKYNRDFKSVFLSCVTGGGGFFLVIGALFMYLYFNNAVEDWWYWNWIYPHTVYTSSNVFNFMNRTVDITSPLLKYITAFLSLFMLGNNIMFPMMYNMFVQYFILISWMVAGFYFLSRYSSYSLTKIERALCFMSLLIFISRLLMTRVEGSDAYNIYLIPAVVCMLPIFYGLYPRYRNILKKGLAVCLVLAASYVPFRIWIVPAQKIFYNAELVEMTELNPGRNLSIIVAPWHPPVYSTKWKPLFYTINSIGAYNTADKIEELKPDIIYLGDSYTPQNLKGFMSDDYHKSGVLYIRNDTLGTLNQ